MYIKFRTKKPNVHLNNIYRFNSYFTENTSRLLHQRKSVQYIYTNNCCYFENHAENKHCDGLDSS